MKKTMLLIGVILCGSSFANVYEQNQNGIPTFTNQKSPGATNIDVGNEPTTYIDDSISQLQELKKIIPNAPNQPYTHHFDNEATMQGDFPSWYTDNYFDFDGKNHTYLHLMSSTRSLTSYGEDGPNDNRLRQAY